MAFKLKEFERITKEMTVVVAVCLKPKNINVKIEELH